MAGSEKTCLYLCLGCFEAFTSPPEDHPHGLTKLIVCDPGEAGDLRRKPLQDAEGILLTQAPRWYLEAIGLIRNN